MIYFLIQYEYVNILSSFLKSETFSIYLTAILFWKRKSNKFKLWFPSNKLVVVVVEESNW